MERLSLSAAGARQSRLSQSAGKLGRPSPRHGGGRILRGKGSADEDDILERLPAP
jgi:hypothetical protein